jgi:hypothetical protein
MREAAVHRYEDVKALGSQFEKFAILLSCPAHSAHGPNLVTGEA